MSRDRALRTLRLKLSEGISHLENLDHPGFMQVVNGYDPWQNPRQAYADAYRYLDIDWIIGIPNRSVKIDSGESSFQSDDGTIYTEWGLSGSAWRENYLFHDVESVLQFDPVANEVGELLVSPEYNQKQIENRLADQDLMGDSCIVSGIYYTTLFQFGIMIFDWALFLEAAACEPKQFQRVLNGFAEVSRRNLEAWVDTKPDLIFLHDDISIEGGIVFHPKWYRKNLFHLYESILEPVKNHPEIKTAFVSDGDYSAVLDDLVALGFDGFVINSPRMDLKQIANKMGHKVFLAGGINTNILTLGSKEDVVQAVQKCLEQTRSANGFFMHSGGDLPHNIPLENIQAYFQTTAEFTN